MKTIDERLAALEAAVADIPKRGRYLEQIERDLRKHAIAFANLKLNCMAIEDDGTRVIYCTTDAETMAAYALKQMQADALNLVRELGVEEQRR